MGGDLQGGNNKVYNTVVFTTKIVNDQTAADEGGIQFTEKDSIPTLPPANRNTQPQQRQGAVAPTGFMLNLYSSSTKLASSVRFTAFLIVSC